MQLRSSERCVVRVSLLAEHRQVMVFAENIRKLVKPANQCADFSGRKGLQQLELMPQILRLFAPLVEICRAGLAGGIQATPAASIDATERMEDQLCVISGS